MRLKKLLSTPVAAVLAVFGYVLDFFFFGTGVGLRIVIICAYVRNDPLLPSCFCVLWRERRKCLREVLYIYVWVVYLGGRHRRRSRRGHWPSVCERLFGPETVYRTELSTGTVLIT